MKAKSKIVRMALMLVAVALLAACHQDQGPTAVSATPRKIAKQIHKSSSDVILVHVWATWCPLCVYEFPTILKVYETYHGRGMDLKLVSADYPSDREAVIRFLQENKSPVNSYVSTTVDDPSFMEIFPASWSGALPASFFFDSKGNLLDSWEGPQSYAEYAATLDKLLKR